MPGASRLGYAMAADGMLPHALAAVHPRFRTPHAALIAQSLVAIALTFVNQIADLISFAVFNLSFAFLLCALSLVRIQSNSEMPIARWRRALPFVAIAIAGGLLIATSVQDKLLGLAVLACRAAVYAVAAPGATIRMRWRCSPTPSG